MPRLDTAKIDYMPSYIAALREGYYIGIQKKNSSDEVAAIEKDPQGFLDNYLRVKTGPVILPSGEHAERVPQNNFWYVEGNEFIGEIGIRHRLNAHLLMRGGHIGYGIRPSRQGQGHATAMLAEGLEYCRTALDLDKVLLTVEDENISSIKVIEKCGGVLENTVIRPDDGSIARRYWITL